MASVLVRRSLVGVVAVLGVLVAFIADAAGQDDPSGKILYGQHCARCHEGEMPTIMLQGSIHDFPADRVFEAINFFIMQRYAGSMTRAEKRAVAEFVAGDPPGSLQPALEQIPRSAYCGSAAVVGNPLVGPAWNGWSPDPSNARFQSVTNGGGDGNGPAYATAQMGVWLSGCPDDVVSGHRRGRPCLRWDEHRTRVRP